VLILIFNSSHSHVDTKPRGYKLQNKHRRTSLTGQVTRICIATATAFVSIVGIMSDGAYAAQQPTWSVSWYGHSDGKRQFDLLTGNCSIFHVTYAYNQSKPYKTSTDVPVGEVLIMEFAHYGNSIASGTYINPPYKLKEPFPAVWPGPTGGAPGQAGIYINDNWDHPKYATVLNVECAPILTPTPTGLGSSPQTSTISFGEAEMKVDHALDALVGEHPSLRQSRICAGPAPDGPSSGIPVTVATWGSLSLKFAQGPQYPGSPWVGYNFTPSAGLLFDAGMSTPFGYIHAPDVMVVGGGTVGTPLSSIEGFVPGIATALGTQPRTSGYVAYLSAFLELKSAANLPVRPGQLEVDSISGSEGNC
jgi:hypothetical protein